MATTRRALLGSAAVAVSLALAGCGDDDDEGGDGNEGDDDTPTGYSFGPEKTDRNEDSAATEETESQEVA